MIDTDQLHLRNLALAQAVAHERDNLQHTDRNPDADKVVETAKKFEEFLRG